MCAREVAMSVHVKIRSGAAELLKYPGCELRHKVWGLESSIAAPPQISDVCLCSNV